MASLQEIIRKHALKNAADHGKAMPSKIIGKVVAEYPAAKSDMKEVARLVAQEAEKVNMLSLQQIQQELSKFEFKAKEEEKKKELALPFAIEGQVVTRFPPEPSGYPHIGHAKAAWLDFECARKYSGKMILRFDDTNPEKESQEFVDAIKEGLAWLGIKWDKESYTSDYMPALYDYADRLLAAKAAYICTCSQEAIKKSRESKTACGCRSRTIEENRQLFEKMKEGFFDEGQAIMRFAGDMSSENTVMRDPTLFRIVKKLHYRQKDKYCCWPSYDFSVSILDSLEGVTHAMRTKEYELRNELYFAILDALSLRKPQLIEFARLEIKNAPVSKRLILPLVQEGKVDGFSDPRLPTLAGLRRRGIVPEAIREFVLEFGLSKVESQPGYEKLFWLNRKFLDRKAQRRFFVPDPVLLEIENVSPRGVAIKNHPNIDLGSRSLIVGSRFYISGEDAKALQPGEVFRLKDLYNVQLVQKESNKLIATFKEETGEVEKKIQWVPFEGAVSCIVQKPGALFDDEGNFRQDSLQEQSGFCEPSCIELPQGAIVQFERYGYCRLDQKSRSHLTFIYSC
ncbi:MAG: glutamate--tRNA ligase [Candidatus Micrarchaeota archaeon]|nr:glutamate--tRNA ligase [Candidatus Micrarchaeota archaeon]